MSAFVLPALPAVMGIVNVTPDSFSDGGLFFEQDRAVQHALHLIDQGATIIDIGGESTRPGAAVVPLDEELNRVIPVIERLSKQTDCLISIDSSKPEVISKAVRAGAGMINDVNALQTTGALEAAAATNALICLMHKQGLPADMQNNPQYQDVVAEVKAFLNLRIEACIEVGIPKHRLILDPGFGFGKSLEHNWQLLAATEQLSRSGIPLLVGLSRKSMFKEISGPEPKERLSASLAATSLAVAHGADIVRCHDVRETYQAVAVGHSFRTCKQA